jgi:hypothetical protein
MSPESGVPADLITTTIIGHVTYLKRGSCQETYFVIAVVLLLRGKSCLNVDRPTSVRLGILNAK